MNFTDKNKKIYHTSRILLYNSDWQTTPTLKQHNTTTFFLPEPHHALTYHINAISIDTSISVLIETALKYNTKTTTLPLLENTGQKVTKLNTPTLAHTNTELFHNYAHGGAGHLWLCSLQMASQGKGPQKISSTCICLVSPNFKAVSSHLLICRQVMATVITQYENI
jgi:hypothetical protein